MPLIGKIALFVAAVAGLSFASVYYGLGRLPGDIVVDRGGGFYFYLPITTSILVSVLLGLLLWLFRR